jgi:hypothetical protein
MNIITRGFGKTEEASTYKIISVCEPDSVSYEYGGLSIIAKELKPTMKTKTPSYYYEEIEE